MKALRRKSILWLLLVSWQCLTSTAVYLRHSHQGGGPDHGHGFARSNHAETSLDADSDPDEPIEHTHFIFLGIEFCFSGDREPTPKAAPESGTQLHSLFASGRQCIVEAPPDLTPDFFATPCVSADEAVGPVSPPVLSRSRFATSPSCAFVEHSRTGVLRA
jgi:hypothetical protein